jgi:hypothetical protein
MVVMQEYSGSGGSRTLVMIPGTTSEKCLETKVEINDDFPTPSITKRDSEQKRENEVKILENQNWLLMVTRHRKTGGMLHRTQRNMPLSPLTKQSSFPGTSMI